MPLSARGSQLARPQSSGPRWPTGRAFEPSSLPPRQRPRFLEPVKLALGVGPPGCRIEAEQRRHHNVLQAVELALLEYGYVTGRAEAALEESAVLVPIVEPLMIGSMWCRRKGREGSCRDVLGGR